MPEETQVFQDMFRGTEPSMKKWGVYMAMDGKPASPTQIVKAHMVKEESGYMRDYVLNERGDLKALYFYMIK